MKAVNLIPTEQRRAQATGKQNGSSYIVIGVLVTLLALVGAYVFTSNNVKDRNSKAAAAKAQADQLEAEVAQRGAFTNFARHQEGPARLGHERREHALRLGAPHARALARDAGGQLAAVERRVRDGRRRGRDDDD